MSEQFQCCCLGTRSSYPERGEGRDDVMDDELSDDKNIHYDDDTMELTLPSGECHGGWGHGLRIEGLIFSFKKCLELHNSKLFFQFLFYSFGCCSGAKIGHRSLMRYYKQRFGTERTLALSHNRNAVGRVLRQYKALGWGGGAGMSQMRKICCLKRLYRSLL